MKKKKLTSILLIVGLLASLVGCSQTAKATTETQVVEKVIEMSTNEMIEKLQNDNKNLLLIKDQGVFSSGGTVTEPVAGEYDYIHNWQATTREGTTAHVDHANTFYQIPLNDTELPMVFLHGYGQSRVGWQTTPDGREG